MTTYVVRVWVPDRPGALGSVASRIGAVRGDLVGIDILERGGGRAIDELLVDLPDASLVPLLISEVEEVDGVDVEDVRPAADWLSDPRLDALETAAVLVDQHSVANLLDRLVSHATHDFTADWAAVVDLDSPVPLTTVGPVPPAPWLEAFVTGSRASASPAAGLGGPDDVAWAELDTASLVLVIGRRGRPFRARERQQLAALARIANHRWVELVTRVSRMIHPSATP
ncbi:MAG: hypothetical protein QOF20_857 [Acidimicrobiaceae bacterium]|jgi:hypothetical protein|nr:hypothetical protein [Acidimicrobiaceae bacterium]MDQ1368504.1 hypothetical protein [Acidimicrobiaceae bacterium]MDQ1399382.1 hypothetical protein [Acidimicrobiaceae bacterium]MDQ1413429.1 hypothetical protein [Acidimicrobiaceae bacterium]MDQ1417546.1 hypothetical protein [Acidimicrobiaceae bacterium]